MEQITDMLALNGVVVGKVKDSPAGNLLLVHLGDRLALALRIEHPEVRDKTTYPAILELPGRTGDPVKPLILDGYAGNSCVNLRVKAVIRWDGRPENVSIGMCPRPGAIALFADRLAIASTYPGQDRFIYWDLESGSLATLPNDPESVWFVEAWELGITPGRDAFQTLLKFPHDQDEASGTG
jgi:hypothetical protein